MAHDSHGGRTLGWDDKYREAAERVRARNEAENREASQIAQQAAQLAHANRLLFDRIDRDVVQPFLRSANSPAGEAASRVVTRSEKRLFGGHKQVLVGRQWTIRLTYGSPPWGPREPGYVRAWDQLTVSSSGWWNYEIKAPGYDSMPDQSITRLGLSAGTGEFFDGALPVGVNREDLYARIENSVLEFMVNHGIRPR
jgi:hypothetical protein